MAKPNLTKEQLDDVISYSDGFYRLFKTLDCTEEELLDSLLDENIETCSQCHTFCDSSELAEEGEEGICENCRGYNEYS